MTPDEIGGLAKASVDRARAADIIGDAERALRMRGD